MSVSSEPVVIRVEVQDANTGPALNAVKNNLVQLGGAGTKAGAEVSAGLQQISGHALTSLDNVRLLRDDLGIRIPRSMERAIAQSQLLSKAIGAMGGGLLAIGAIDIGIRIAEGLHSAYEKWVDVDGAVRKYQEDAMKAAQQKLFDEGALETQIAMMGDLNSQIDALIARKNSSAGLSGKILLGQDYFSPTDAKNLGALLDEQHQHRLQQIEEEFKAREQGRAMEMKRAEAAVPEYARPAIERSYAGLRASDEQVYQQRRDAYLVNSYNEGIPGWNKDHPDQPRQEVGLPADDGSAKYQAQKEAADADFNLKQKDRARATAEEISEIHEQALESELHGDALYAQKMSAEIGKLQRKGIASASAVADVKARYDSEALARIRKEELATEEIQMRAAMAGMTGFGKSQGEDLLETGRTMADEDLTPEVKAARIAAIHQQANAEMVQQEREFAQQMDSITDSSAAHQISGFARIQAEAQKQLDDVKKRFEDLTRGMDMAKPVSWYLYGGAATSANRADASIKAGAGQQTADLARKNEQETEQIESQARAKLLASEKQKTAAIAAEYEDRVRKYQEQLDQQEISQDDFNRRVVAAQEEANAQMRQQAQETAQKVAGELSGLFSAHPLEALERMGQKYAGQATAALLSRAMGGSATGAPKTDGLAALFTHLSGTSVGSPISHGSTRAASSFAHAEIHVDQASIFASGGGGGGGAFSGGSFSGAPGAMGIPGSAGGGSTWMLPSGGHTSFGGSTASPFGVSMGSGFAGVGGGAQSYSSTPVGSAPPPGPGFSGYAGTALRGVSTARSIAGMIGGGGSGGGVAPFSSINGSNDPLGLNAPSPNLTGMQGAANTAAAAANPSAYSQSMMGGGMTMQNGMNAAGGAIGLFSAYKQGGAGGMMGGAMSGAKLGMAVGGPIGAAVGAAAGLAIGFMGGGEQARVWWMKQGRPRLEGDMQQFQQGGMDYLSAAMDMEQLGNQAKTTLDKMGMTGTRYYENTAQPEIRDAVEKLNREQRAGRSASPASAAQYSTGTDSVPAMLTPGERVIPTDQNERITRALENQQSPRMAPASQGGDIHLHVHAIDAKSSLDFLMDNSEGVRASLNKSIGDYGGLADVSA